jgi:hypothetical protein
MLIFVCEYFWDKLRIFENRVLGIIFVPKEKGTGGLGQFHNDLPHNFYFLPKSVMMIKKKNKMRWAGMWHIWKRRQMHTKF